MGCNFVWEMKIDVHKVTQGVAVAKYRLSKWIGHLEKTMVQQGETIVKTMMIQNFGPI